MAYYKGALVRCRTQFRDPETQDAYVDPASVTFKVRAPNGTTTTYVYGTDAQLVKESVGHYRADVNADQAGQWTFRFESGGTYQDADEATFTVLAGAF